MKMLAMVSIEVDAPARQMQLADVLMWFAAGLMIDQDEDKLLEPQSGVIEFQGSTVGKYFVLPSRRSEVYAGVIPRV